MKNSVIGILILALLCGCAGNDNATESKKSNKEYSILWGASESEDYTRMSKKIDKRRDSLISLRDSLRKDTTAYHIKSYLWGAIKIAKKEKDDE